MMGWLVDSGVIIIVVLVIQIVHVRSGEGRPNFVFILADDLGVGSFETDQAIGLGIHANTNASIRTTRIRQLSREGLVFDRLYADSPICSASRYAIMTGIQSGSAFSRVRGNMGSDADHTLKANGEVAFPELLKKAGYKTAMFGKWGFRDKPSECGFDYFLGTRSHIDSLRFFAAELSEDKGKGLVKLTNRFTKRNKGITRGIHEMSSCHLRESRCDYIPTVLHQQALSWLDANYKDPFFLYIPTQIPHDGGFDKGRPGNIMPIPSLNPGCDTCVNYEKRLKPEHQFYGYSEKMASVGSSISNYFDVQVAEVIDKLKSLGVYDNTVIIITSDNGGAIDIADSKEDRERILGNPMYINGDFRGYKRQLFDGAIRVPNLFIWPKIGTSGVRKKVIRLSDFAPTFIELAGISDVPVQFNGRSFALSLFKDQPNLSPEYLYNEICLNDNGVLGEHRECDFAVTFGENYAFRAEWSSRYPKKMDLTILDQGSGYTRRSGNLTVEDLRKRKRKAYRPDIRSLVQDPMEMTPVNNGTSDNVLAMAEAIVLQHRIVPVDTKANVPSTFVRKQPIDFASLLEKDRPEEGKEETVKPSTNPTKPPVRVDYDPDEKGESEEGDLDPEVEIDDDDDSDPQIEDDNNKNEDNGSLVSADTLPPHHGEGSTGVRGNIFGWVLFTVFLFLSSNC